MKYFIARKNSKIRIIADQTSLKYVEHCWNEFDEVYPLDSKFHYTFECFQKEGKEVDFLLKTVFDSHRNQLFSLSSYDKRGEERKKVLAGYLNQNPKQVL